MNKPSKRMIELLDTLLDQTKSGAITWRQTDLPGTYLYVGQSGSVLLRGDYDDIAALKEVGPGVEILDRAGESVETYDPPPELAPAILKELVQEIRERWYEGSPLLDTLRTEIQTLAASA